MFAPSRLVGIVVASALGFLAAGAAQPAPAPVAQYKNFAVAIYIPVAVVRHLAEPGVLETEWAAISGQVKVDKVYIESERDRLLADDAMLETVKTFFVNHGVRVAGGITFSDNAGVDQFKSFCYTDPADRAFVKGVVELTARHFDEIILDDFFFVTTKYESDIAAKGARTWTQFRLELMDEVGRNLVVGAATAVNPRAKVTIKYPNWYEHFAGLGFDLQEGPKIYAGIYTGTETRDPNLTDQYLQQYESYQIIRYFENIAPGRNGGGWVDTYGSFYVDRYAEQLWDTMFAKAREMTLFNWEDLLHPVVPGARQAWAAKATSVNYDQLLGYHPAAKPAPGAAPATMARAAGYALEQADAVVGHLGTPVGLASYRPPHATGEDFLHNYLGMIGLPIDLHPTFPENAPIVLLTQDAAGDPEIVARIKRQLLAGKTVVITSGLVQALQGHGIEELVELETSGRRILADGYAVGFPGNRPALANSATGAPAIAFPQIGFLTNDAWALVCAMADGVGYPVLLFDRYGPAGRLYVWTMPDNFHNLYQLPVPVVSAIKDTLMAGFPVRLDGPNEIALFAYDNSTFVVESFLAGDADVQVRTLGPAVKLRDLVSGEVITGQPFVASKERWHAPEEPRTTFKVHVAPHSYRAFKLEP